MVFCEEKLIFVMDERLVTRRAPLTINRERKLEPKTETDMIDAGTMLTQRRWLFRMVHYSLHDVM
jgi:hypothetical protein